jgi:hypothetical protein
MQLQRAGTAAVTTLVMLRVNLHLQALVGWPVLAQQAW